MERGVKKEEGAPPLHEELTLADLDRAFEKLVGRSWDSWPPLTERWASRHHEYFPLYMWDAVE
jgi:hypothetical protein